MKIEYITQGQQDELLDKYATLHEEYKHHTIIKTASFSGMHFFDNICSLKPEM